MNIMIRILSALQDQLIPKKEDVTELTGAEWALKSRQDHKMDQVKEKVKWKAKEIKMANSMDGKEEVITKNGTSRKTAVINKIANGRMVRQEWKSETILSDLELDGTSE